MPKGNRTPRTKKQLEAARRSKGGGRPRTGKMPQRMISFPADWVERISALIPPGVPKNRWIMEQVEKGLSETKNK